MLFSTQVKGPLEKVKRQEAIFWSSGYQRQKSSIREGLEPNSVLDHRRSPSPPTSTSTLSSSLGGAASSDTAGVAAVSCNNPVQKWQLSGPNGYEMGFVEGSDKCKPGVDVWETMLSESLIMENNNAGFGFGLLDPAGFGVETVGGIGCSSSQSPPPLPPNFCKVSDFGNQISNHLTAPPPPATNALPLFAQEFGQPHVGYQPIPFPDASGVVPELILRRNQQPMPPKPEDNAAAFVDHLFDAAKMVEAGNFVSATGILARLNHQLPVPIGAPLLRSSFYFKEALQLIVSNSTRPPPVATPLDVVLKLAAYKAFSEVSPVLQFTNFTCVQALLEELGNADRIHIIDFDIGVGGQWSSFMQEIAQRRSRATGAAPMLKVTAYVTPSSHHSLELYLVRDNLCHFASNLNIPFQFNILSLDTFDPSELIAMGGESIAVNLPVGSTCSLVLPALLPLVKQLSPRIIVSVDNGCNRCELPFSAHFLHAFQSCTLLMDSIDAAGTNLDVVNKMEKYLLQPRIENSLVGRHTAGDEMLPWRALFMSAGFTPVRFSNFAETQAECLLKRMDVKGFHVDKRDASLFLYWHRGELVSVSAWRS
ncbi:scarecrow-like protein 6 [Typha angustifolia]|uniref:scarecrow-like protein 6 n=1 Tax=Typha angustifolia TaxID=59011 RepID=UPI003C305F34